MVSRLLGSVEDDSRGETYASNMKLRLLKGKRKKEKCNKRGEQSPGRGIELPYWIRLNCSHRTGVELTPGLPRLARLTSGTVID